MARRRGAGEAQTTAQTKAPHTKPIARSTQVPAPPRGHVAAYLPHQCLQSRRNPIRNPISDGAEKRQLHRSHLLHAHARTRTQANTHARTYTHTDSACVERAHTGATSMINLPQPLLCFETTRRYTAIGRGRHPAAGREVAGSSPPARSSRTKPTPHHEHSARALSPALCWTSLMLRRSRHAGCHCGCCGHRRRCRCRRRRRHRCWLHHCCGEPRPRPRLRSRPATKNG